MIEITLPPVSMALSPNRKNGKSFYSTHRKKIADKNIGFIAALPYAMLLRANTDYSMEIIFYHATKRRPDIDNLHAASKARLDGIAAALGVDDSCFEPVLLRRKYRKNDAGMIIKINKLT